MSRDAERLLERVFHLMELGRPQAAVAAASDAIAAAPTSNQAHGMLAWACFASRRYQDALDAAERSVALAPDEEWGHRLRGECLAALRRPEEALAAFSEGVRLEPELPEAHLSLGRQLLRMKKTTEATAVADALKRIAPDFAPGFALAARIQMARREHERAAGELRQALALDAANERYLALYSRALAGLESTPEAYEHLDFAIRLNPQSLTVQTEAERLGQEEEETQANLLMLSVVFTLGGLFVGWLAFRNFLDGDTAKLPIFVPLSALNLFLGIITWRLRPDRPPEGLLRYFREVRRQRLKAAWRLGFFSFVLALLWAPRE